MTKYSVGDKVAWNMQDGNVMVGTVQYLGFSSIDLKRVDGGMCTIKDSRESWIASLDDIDKAIAFYTV